MFNPLLGEALAALAASRIAHDCGWDVVDFESDCQSLWKESASDQLHGVLICDVVLSMHGYFLQHPLWKFSWTSRCQNGLPHLLAKWAMSSRSFDFISPSSIQSCILFCDVGFSDPVSFD